MTNNTTATIVFSGTEETAPLYCKYQGQFNPQPAYVTLNLENGHVDADYSGEIGNAVTMDVWHNRTLRWSINSQLSGSQVQEILEDILPTLQTILDGSEIEWNGNNWVGRIVTDAARAADEKMDRDSEYGLGYDIETSVITDLKEWLANGGRDCWMPTESDDVEQYITQFDLDGYTALEDVRETLMDLWADELYSGEAVQQNVAQYLLASEHCAGSAWLDELKAYANGQQPE